MVNSEHDVFENWPPGVPKEEGTPFGEVADRLRAETVDLSCPQGCFELEVSGSHETRDDSEFLADVAIADDFDACPHCGAPIGGDADGE